MLVIPIIFITVKISIYAVMKMKFEYRFIYTALR